MRQKDLKAIEKKMIKPGFESSSLCDVRNALVSKGVDKDDLQCTSNNLNDYLYAWINGYVFHLEKPTFPKRRQTSIVIELKLEESIRWNVVSRSSCESIANFLIEFSLWAPSYTAYKSGLIAKNEQQKMICELGLDLLKRNIEPKLTEKVYTYYITNNSSIAVLNIRISEEISFKVEVNLLGDFLEDLLELAASLPARKI